MRTFVSYKQQHTRTNCEWEQFVSYKQQHTHTIYEWEHLCPTSNKHTLLHRFIFLLRNTHIHKQAHEHKTPRMLPVCCPDTEKTLRMLPVCCPDTMYLQCTLKNKGKQMKSSFVSWVASQKTTMKPVMHSSSWLVSHFLAYPAVHKDIPSCVPYWHIPL